MICPKCGFDQPESPECMRCGIIVARYRGPAVTATPAAPFAAPAAPAAPYPWSAPQPARPAVPPPPVISGGTALAPPPVPPPVPPAPMMAAAPRMDAAPAGGTLYAGPSPAMAAAGGGTIYGGPPPGSPAAYAPAAPRRTMVVSDFTAGKVLSETFSIYGSNFIPFVLLCLLVSLPALLFCFGYKVELGDPRSLLTFVGVVIVLQGLATQVAAAGITYGVYHQMLGQSVSIADCLGAAFSSLFPVLGVSICCSIAIIAGLAACFIPGILIALALCVAVPVTVEERPGVFEAMRRSSYLTTGYRGHIFGALFVLGIVQQIVVRLVGLGVKDPSTLMMVATGIGVFTNGLGATASAVMYYRLRSAKESIDVGQIASVFA